MNKGISTVIAALLMLIITIALAGFAYTYISGVLTQRTAVSLSLAAADCLGDSIVVTVTNSGTAASGSVSVTATHSGGTGGGSCNIATIGAASSGECTINRPAATPTGTYTVRVSGGGSVATGSSFCTTAGV